MEWVLIITLATGPVTVPRAYANEQECVGAGETAQPQCYRVTDLFNRGVAAKKWLLRVPEAADAGVRARISVHSRVTSREVCRANLADLVLPIAGIIG